MATAPGDTRLSARRVAGRAEFARILCEHIKACARAGQSLVPAWAVTWGVSEQQVRRWYDETRHHSALAAGDVDALDPADLVPLLERWLAAARARLAPVAPMGDPRLIVVALLDGAGDVAKAVRKALSAKSRGGAAVTASEWAAIERELAALERQVREAKLAARAARELTSAGAR